MLVQQSNEPERFKDLAKEPESDDSEAAFSYSPFAVLSPFAKGSREITHCLRRTLSAI